MPTLKYNTPIYIQHTKNMKKHRTQQKSNKNTNIKHKNTKTQQT